MTLPLAAAIGCAAAVLPVWPYGYYVLLRLLVAAAAVATLATSQQERARNWMVLGALLLVFNPVVPIHLNRVLWVPIDLMAAWLLYRTHERLMTDDSVDVRPETERPPT